MLSLGSIYLIVKNMEKSISFYEKLLDMKPTARAFDRWAQFDFDGHCIALYNNDFDKRKIEGNDDISAHYNAEYIENYKRRAITYGNNAVLNFWIENLRNEYDRISKLAIGEISKIMYVNISSPYYFFTVIDPDGNIVEITGKYAER